MDDVKTVMDAVGSERAALFGISEGGPMSLLFAATYPERTIALVIYGSYARRSQAPDHPWGFTEAQWDTLFPNHGIRMGRTHGTRSGGPRALHMTRNSRPGGPPTFASPPAPVQHWP